MKISERFLILFLGLIVVSGCERKQELSPEEIPSIKNTLVELEQVIRVRDTVYFDSIISSDAVKSAERVFEFVYAGNLDEFLGFTDKKIAFRGNRARCDCYIHGPDGPVRPVTITLRKEREVWLFKNIEPQVDKIIEETDTI
jgi:hypothetical protein